MMPGEGGRRKPSCLRVRDVLSWERRENEPNLACLRNVGWLLSAAPDVV